MTRRPTGLDYCSRSFHPDLNGLVVGVVFHFHDLSLLAFLDDGGDAVPVQVGVLHLRRKGLGHLHTPLAHPDRDFEIHRGGPGLPPPPAPPIPSPSSPAPDLELRRGRWPQPAWPRLRSSSWIASTI